jgi:hypothetical protein
MLVTQFLSTALKKLGNTGKKKLPPWWIVSLLPPLAWAPRLTLIQAQMVQYKELKLAPRWWFTHAASGWGSRKDKSRELGILCGT